ncbi:hypothetical protein ACROYT_G041739 [Oculina patagonica]
MVLRRFVSIRGYPSKLYSDNGPQLVSANEELKRIIKDFDQESLKQFGVTQGLQWIFSSADAPWQNGTSEALIKSIKKAITVAVGEDDKVRKVHVVYKNPKAGEPLHKYSGRGYVTVERSINRLVLVVPVDEKDSN